MQCEEDQKASIMGSTFALPQSFRWYWKISSWSSWWPSHVAGILWVLARLPWLERLFWPAEHVGISLLLWVKSGASPGFWTVSCMEHSPPGPQACHFSLQSLGTWTSFSRSTKKETLHPWWCVWVPHTYFRWKKTENYFQRHSRTLLLALTSWNINLLFITTPLWLYSTWFLEGVMNSTPLAFLFQTEMINRSIRTYYVPSWEPQRGRRRQPSRVIRYRSWPRRNSPSSEQIL